MHYPNAAIDRAQSYKEFLSPALARTKNGFYCIFSAKGFVTTSKMRNFAPHFSR